MRTFICGALALGTGVLIAALPVTYAGEVTEEHRTYQEEHSETVHQAAPAVERRTETTVKKRADNDNDDNDNRDVDVEVKTKTKEH